MLNSALWQSKRVLLTGHTGFKGVWLTNWLIHLGADVLGFSLPPEGSTYRLFRESRLENQIQSRYGDIQDLSKLHQVCAEFQPELILHLAAQSLVRKSYSEPVQTYASNVMGTVHVLEAVRLTPSVKAALVITTDKCYENKEWLWPYRENDSLGGHDPYSNSKACAELVSDAYRRSFLQTQGKLIATARAGNVIGGGDLAEDRLIPDAMRAFHSGQNFEVRNPSATRPWQHVLDPLYGYLLLAEKLLKNQVEFAQAFNFGPSDEHSVGKVVETLVEYWDGEASTSTPTGTQPHEACRLHLDSNRARTLLEWQPKWDLPTALRSCVNFYRPWLEGECARTLLERDLERFLSR